MNRRHYRCVFTFVDVIGEQLTFPFLHANDRIINKKKKIYQSNIQLMHENMDTFVISKQYEIKHIDIYYNKSIYYNNYIK